MTDHKTGIKSTGTVFSIIEYLSNNDGAGVSEIARELELAKSTVHDHLTSLVREELVVKTDGGYRLGLRFLNLGMTVKENRELPRIANSKLRELAEETGEVVWLIVEEHGRAVYLDGERGEKTVQIEFTIGNRVPLHSIAAGKSILAKMPRDRVEEIIDEHGLPAQTEHTVTDRDALFEELDGIRDRGYAFNESGLIEGVRAVGAPICYRGEVLGAVSVAGAERSLQGDRYRKELPSLLRSATSEIEVQINYAHSEFSETPL